MRNVLLLGPLAAAAGLILPYGGHAIAQYDRFGAAFDGSAVCRDPGDCMEITAQTRRDDLIARWGNPIPQGLTGEIDAYALAGLSRLWLSFTETEPRTVIRAIVIAPEPSEELRVMVNDMEITKTRRAEQVDFSRPLTSEQLIDAWGPPDSVGGSGIISYSYAMADGTSFSIALRNGRPEWAGGPPGTMPRPRE